MDKITSGIIDKLNIIGFFNVIISGGILLYGISPVLHKYVPGLFYSQLGLEQDFEKGLLTCLLCFIIGCALQSIQEFLFKGLRSRVVNKCLATPAKSEEDEFGESVLVNKHRQKGIINQAAKLFADKNLGVFDPEDKEMCSYFIDYCEYSNTMKGFNSKSSRLSESAAFYEQLAVAFYMLAAAGILAAVITRTNTLLCCVAYLAMGSIFTGRAYQYHLSWARVVLSTYEVVTDQEMHKKA